MFKNIFFSICIVCFSFFSINPLYAADVAASKEKSQQIKEITVFAKNIVNEALKAARNKDRAEAYIQVSDMINKYFDCQNMLKFAFARNYKKLTDEQIGYMTKYSKRSIVLLFLEKFIFKSMTYEISKIVERKNIFDVYLIIHSVEGLQLDKLAKDMHGNEAKDVEVIISVTPKGKKYILQDIKAMEISFLNMSRDFFQKMLKKNGDDIDTMIDDLLGDLDQKEIHFRGNQNVPASLFPPIKMLLEIE